MNKFNIKNAVELEKLGYHYYEDDGFSEFLKATNVPDKLNTEYIDFKSISFNRLERECSQIYEDFLGKTRLVNEDIFNEVDTILSKYKEIIGGKNE